MNEPCTYCGYTNRHDLLLHRVMSRDACGVCGLLGAHESWCADTTTWLADQHNRPHGPAVCGTRGGYQRHRRLGELACPPCRRANTARSAEWQRRARASAAAQATSNLHK